MLSLITFFYSNEKLVGLWKSIDNSSIKYLNIKSNGIFLEIKDNTTSRFNYKEKEIHIRTEGGRLTRPVFRVSNNKMILDITNMNYLINHNLLMI